jgi:hypothetical protein
VADEQFIFSNDDDEQLIVDDELAPSPDAG